ncbi:hypothetical protein CAEBREN_08513 [Caenorhabditis brenneri]|uniref:BTB domain-containing protein n=1 Tax=Caenorhabditis brenneri TaxID=135651 RepID=G0P567_CAEBE|nr:hypothetical protein CAEBREN_08513 [Caenorhabditis brenneri]
MRGSLLALLLLIVPFFAFAVADETASTGKRTTETQDPNIYEKTCAKSDKTDVILVVDGKKLHVNKAPINTIWKISLIMLYHCIHQKRIISVCPSIRNLIVSSQVQQKKNYLTTFFLLIKMTETPEPSIYEKTFAKSERTDAILVVDGKKLHVNKALLSYHSDYFNSLFNSDFTEKSKKEIEIKDVDFEDFATLLSLIQDNPLEINKRNAEPLLELADRFLMRSPKLLVANVVKNSTEYSKFQVLLLADKYDLEDLIDYSLTLYDSKDDFEDLYYDRELLHKLSDATKGKLFEKYFGDAMNAYDLLLEKQRRLAEEAKRKKMKKPNPPEPSMYEKAFAKSDKTDAILVVDGKKLHVNKALLSYHSDYFNTLFNSNFMEKSMEEIEIKDVKIEDFATLLSLVHDNHIVPETGSIKTRKEVDLSAICDLIASASSRGAFPRRLAAKIESRVDVLTRGRYYPEYISNSLRANLFDETPFRHNLAQVLYNLTARLPSNLYYRELDEIDLSVSSDPSVWAEAFKKFSESTSRYPIYVDSENSYSAPIEGRTNCALLTFFDVEAEHVLLARIHKSDQLELDAMQSHLQLFAKSRMFATFDRETMLEAMLGGGSRITNLQIRGESLQRAAARVGIRLHKGQTMTDWSRHCLRGDQLEYAAMDAVVLHHIREGQISTAVACQSNDPTPSAAIHQSTSLSSKISNFPHIFTM